MKTQFILILIAISLNLKSQTYQVKMAQQPQWNPSPLLKKYDNSSYQSSSQNNEYKAPEAAPAEQEYRIFGYYNENDNGTLVVKTMNLMVTAHKELNGAEKITIQSFKELNDSQWQTPYVKLAAYFTSGDISANYNYSVNISGKEVFFKF
jgi:hypothetical protein